ncbi:hypothetical protein LTR85_007254 [Meristemomyces frigidus]|nr:hypothetical protein LTR85_007254 [Meristemomyces frigidus]
MLRALSERFTPNASSTDLTATKARPDGFVTAKGIDALFPRTKPEVDGDECLHDCQSCTIHYPKKFSIDEEDKLYGEIKGWSRHVIVATGKTDWVRDVEEEKGSVMEAVGKHGGEVEGGKLMLSASNMPTPEHHAEHEGPYGKDRPTRVLLLPAFQFVEGVTPRLVPELIRHVINTAPTNTQRLPTSSEKAVSTNGTSTPTTPSTTEGPPSLSSLHLSAKNLPDGLSLHACPHKYLILLCSQATRDARCGQSAPLLRRELERHLRPLGLYRDLGDDRPGGVGIYFISHVGGHKYSANMLVYRKAEPKRTVQELISSEKDGAEGEAAQCLWLARIKPEDCENVVRFTVLQGKVVKPESQLRGGFDREKGVVNERYMTTLPGELRESICGLCLSTNDIAQPDDVDGSTLVRLLRQYPGLRPELSNRLFAGKTLVFNTRGEQDMRDLLGLCAESDGGLIRSISRIAFGMLHLSSSRRTPERHREVLLGTFARFLGLRCVEIRTGVGLRVTNYEVASLFAGVEAALIAPLRSAVYSHNDAAAAAPPPVLRAIEIRDLEFEREVQLFMSRVVRGGMSGSEIDAALELALELFRRQRLIKEANVGLNEALIRARRVLALDSFRRELDMWSMRDDEAEGLLGDFNRDL